MDLLPQLRQALATQYRESLSLTLTDWNSAAETLPGPLWIFAKTSDLTTRTSTAVDSVGVIIDPDIATVLYAVPFGRTAVLDFTVNRILALQTRLLREHNYVSSTTPKQFVDTLGSWTIGVLWLVEEDQKERWTQQIVARRHN